MPKGLFRAGALFQVRQTFSGLKAVAMLLLLILAAMTHLGCFQIQHLHPLPV